MLRANTINVLPLNNVYGAIVLAMDTSNVDSVFIAGKARKLAGQLVDVDLQRIARMAEQSRDYIVARVGLAADAVRRLSARSLRRTGLTRCEP